MSTLIALVFFIGFFCESMFGFGGLLISFAILSFFIDIKEIIPVAVYVGTLASCFVLVTDRKSIDWLLLLKTVFPLAFLGTVTGVVLFSYLSNEILLKIFALFLIVIAAKSLILGKLSFMKYLKYPLLYAGGIMHGIYGVGGPFTLLAVKQEFKNKSYLRSTMAVYFILFNLVRIIQFRVTEQFAVKDFFVMWWLILPIFVAVFLGYRIHVKISEEIFRKIINILLLMAGVIYILR